MVDDDPLIRWSVVRCLEAFCTEARSASSGELALAILREWPVDVLVADAALGASGAGELLRRCQGLRFHPRVILMTSGEAASPVKELEELGVIGVVEKPLVLDSLPRVLSRLLQEPDHVAP